MRPDSYIRFEPGPYFAAVEGHSSDIKWGYWKAIAYYRCHNHCRGLENNDDFLRRLCEIDKDKWEHAKSIIFGGGEFFSMDENGLWHQKKAEMDWMEDVQSYEMRVRRSESANKKRWNGSHKK